MERRCSISVRWQHVITPSSSWSTSFHMYLRSTSTVSIVDSSLRPLMSQEPRANTTSSTRTLPPTPLAFPYSISSTLMSLGSLLLSGVLQRSLGVARQHVGLLLVALLLAGLERVSGSLLVRLGGLASLALGLAFWLRRVAALSGSGHVCGFGGEVVFWGLDGVG